MSRLNLSGGNLFWEIEARNKNTIMTNPKVLIIYYSFSGQTIGLLHRLAEGLREEAIDVRMERLYPVKPLFFPLSSIPATLKMMFTTFVRKRVPIKNISAECFEDYDLIILAGPTWSYNPSGPVLSLIDRYGTRLFSGKTVMPLISCRGYWRMHWRGLRKILQKCGAMVPNLIVFDHPCREPWRTIGVFLKIAGKHPERSEIIGKYYKRYGHSREQQEESFRFGVVLGKTLKKGAPLEDLCLRSLAGM